jgi:hypothetical protein
LRPQDAQDVAISLVGEPRNAITRSDIVAGNEAVGSIFFSVSQA